MNQKLVTQVTAPTNSMAKLPDLESIILPEEIPLPDEIPLPPPLPPDDVPLPASEQPVQQTDNLEHQFILHQQQQAYPYPHPPPPPSPPPPPPPPPKRVKQANSSQEISSLSHSPPHQNDTSRSRKKRRRENHRDQDDDDNNPSELGAGNLKSEQEMMARMMGFSNFNSTKGKPVPGNQSIGAVHVVKKQRCRQYMNRKGGFNRPLDKTT